MGELRDNKTSKELEAEPRVVSQDGTVSDASEHAAMLDNPAAEKLSDEAAWRTGRELGFSDDDLREMFDAV